MTVISTEAYLTGVALAESVITQTADDTIHRLPFLADRLCNRILAISDAAAVTGNPDVFFVLVWLKMRII